MDFSEIGQNKYIGYVETAGIIFKKLRQQPANDQNSRRADEDNYSIARNDFLWSWLTLLFLNRK